MSELSEAAIRIRVDPTNPGQFFACCGLLELSDRLWEGAEGWFEGDTFCVRALAPATVENPSLESLLRAVKGTVFKQIDSEDPYASGIEIPAPFGLRIDWWKDDHAGGKRFKTWAGQQKVVEIASGMKEGVDPLGWGATPPDRWLLQSTFTGSLPFNFDSDLGSAGSDLDVGFSFDPLKSIRTRRRPLLELSAFVGIQRFRPAQIEREDRYRYWLWQDPMVPEIASAAACGHIEAQRSEAFEFGLLYRTDYLKSFLPATPIARS